MTQRESPGYSNDRDATLILCSNDLPGQAKQKNFTRGVHLDFHICLENWVRFHTAEDIGIETP
jgi:hypothetical protein